MVTKALIDHAYEKARELIKYWHDNRIGQIRLETSNKRSLQEHKYASITEIENTRNKRRRANRGSYIK